MAMRIGGLTLTDLLSNRFQSVVDFGESNFEQVVNNELVVHNRLTGRLMSDIAVQTADKQRIAGEGDVGEMEEANEFTRADTQKVAGGATLGFPLRLKVYGMGWTRRWFMLKKVADVAQQVVRAKKAHLKGLARDLKRAIYGSANYTYRDDLDTPVIDLAVKRFCNADSFPIPEGPNGELFTAASHQHYTAAGSLLVADILALISNVTEHGHTSDVRVIVNVANQAAVEALTGFIPFRREQIVLSTASDHAEIRQDLAQANDKQIGFLGAATVWVKPWAITGYAFCYAAGDDLKPLVMRTRDGSNPGLAIVGEIDAHPLRAEYWETEYGVGTWNRTNGAVHQFTNGSYQNPTIT